MARKTADELLTDAKLTRAAEAKLRDDPLAVTAGDLEHIRPSLLSDAMAAGRLEHLGYGRSSKFR
jgi:hypothetical protein